MAILGHEKVFPILELYLNKWIISNNKKGEERLERSYASLSEFIKVFSPKGCGKKRFSAFKLTQKQTGTELIPSDGNEDLLQKLTKNEKLTKMGVIKKVRKTKGYHYVVGQKWAQAVPRNFYWIALKSSSDPECLNLWALMHLVLKSRSVSRAPEAIAVSPEEISCLTDHDVSECSRWLSKLVKNNKVVQKGNKFFVEKNVDFLLLQELTKVVPSIVDELVMNFMCSNYVAKKSDLLDYYNSTYGESAVYKSSEALEKEEFITAKSVKQPGKKGPAPDTLQVCCDNCFFFFSSIEECRDSQIDDFITYIEDCFGKKLTDEETARARVSLLRFADGDQRGQLPVRRLKLILQDFEQLKKLVGGEESLRLAVSFLQKELGVSLVSTNEKLG